MQTYSTHSESRLSYRELAGFAALGGAVLLLFAGWRRAPIARLGLSAAAAMLAYRGFAGRWPAREPASGDDTRARLAGTGGVHVRESIHLERSPDVVYAFWRRLENLPRFMTHLQRVTELDDRRSHWVAKGPADLSVEWDAEIINDVPGKVIGWRSLAGGDVVVAGSVNFDAAENGRGSNVTVHLQYDPPAGRAGALVAALFDREPSQMIRADLQRLQQLFDRDASVEALPPADRSI